MSEVVTKPVYQYDPKVAAIHRLRVNVKSLAAEAKIIRKEAKRCGALYEMELTAHRRGKVRHEARAAQLALAFVRGRRYHSVEKKCHHFDFEPIARKLCRAGVFPYHTDALVALNKWVLG